MGSDALGGHLQLLTGIAVRQTYSIEDLVVRTFLFVNICYPLYYKHMRNIHYNILYYA